jgi:hypothetical protein
MPTKTSRASVAWSDCAEAHLRGIRKPCNEEDKQDAKPVSAETHAVLYVVAET